MVEVLKLNGLLSFVHPSAHRARWKPGPPEFGELPRPLTDFEEYLKLKSYSDVAMQNIGHALLSGIGFLYVWKEKSLVDVVELVMPFNIYT